MKKKVLIISGAALALTLTAAGTVITVSHHQAKGRYHAALDELHAAASEKLEAARQIEADLDAAHDIVARASEPGAITMHKGGSVPFLEHDLQIAEDEYGSLAEALGTASELLDAWHLPPPFYDAAIRHEMAHRMIYKRCSQFDPLGVGDTSETIASSYAVLYLGADRAALESILAPTTR